MFPICCLCVFCSFATKHVSTSLRTPFCADQRTPSAFELSNHPVWDVLPISSQNSRIQMSAGTLSVRHWALCAATFHLRWRKRLWGQLGRGQLWWGKINVAMLIIHGSLFFICHCLYFPPSTDLHNQSSFVQCPHLFCLFCMSVPHKQMVSKLIRRSTEDYSRAFNY